MTAVAWDPTKHPRHPAGSEAGGEFAPSEVATSQDNAQTEGGRAFLAEDALWQRGESTNAYWNPDADYAGRKGNWEMKLSSDWQRIDPSQPHVYADLWPQSYQSWTDRHGSEPVLIDTSPPNPRGAADFVKKWIVGRGGQDSFPWFTELRAEYAAQMGLPDPGITRTWYPHEGRPPSPPELREATAKFIEILPKAPPEQPALWRGLGDVGDEWAKIVAEAKPGDTLDMLPASYSRSSTRAQQYISTSERPGVMLYVLPGSRGLGDKRPWLHDEEVLSAGRYEVVASETVNPVAERKKAPWLHKRHPVRIVTVRQLSPRPGLTAAAWVESAHRRHPAGTAEGGEFAPVAGRVGPDVNPNTFRGVELPYDRAGFPPGMFTPEDSVKFWPDKMGAYSGFRQDAPYGPFWKAIVDPNTGEEKAFWFTDVNGSPHHLRMIDALGISQDVHYTLPSGYGERVSSVTMRDMPEDPYGIVARHRRDLKDANAMLPEDQQDRALAAAAWVESAHRRHPAGDEKGGEFAPLGDRGFINDVRQAFTAERQGFPPGIFSPEDSVKFWPERIGEAGNGVLWKAWMDPISGEEKAFWFVGPTGFPHHTDMARALGIEMPKVDEVLKGPLRVSGYGSRPDMDWLPRYFRRDMQFDKDELQRLPNNPLHDHIMASVDEIPKRHRKDIRDATEMVRGATERYAMAASGLADDEAVAAAFVKLQLQYEKVYRRAAKRAAEAYRAATHVVLASAQPPVDEVLAAKILLESFMRLTGVARRDLLRHVLNALQIVQTDVQVEQGDEGDQGFGGQALLNYLELLEQQAGVQAERLVAGAQDAVADVLLQAMAEGWPVPQTAKAIQVKLETVAPWQATMLARTDLVALGNGASMQRAVALQDPESAYKTWLATPDERTRINHRHAHGQTVPVGQPFNVGGEQLLYPGDPSASDGNVINCRCTIIYGPSAFGPPGIQQIAMLPDLAVSAAAWDESSHPRHPKGSDQGGEFVSKGLAMLPPGEFRPKEKVKFWPDRIGLLDGAPMWKALMDEAGNERAFWFVDSQGVPHHHEMAWALGMKSHLDREKSDEERNSRVGGYGILVDFAAPARWIPAGPENEDERARLRQLAIDIPIKHRKDIKDAEVMAYGPLRAGAWLEEEHPRHPAGSEEGGEFAAEGAAPLEEYAARDSLYDNYGDWAQGLSKEQKDAFQAWRSEVYYQDMNQLMRGMDPADFKGADYDQVYGYTETLRQTMFDAPKIQKPVKVWRGVDAATLTEAAGVSSVDELVGKTMYDDGFRATTLHGGLEDQYGDTSIHITVPKGYPAIWASAVEQAVDKDWLKGLEDWEVDAYDSELVLPPGGFKVTGVHRNARGQVTLEAEAVDPW